MQPKAYYSQTEQVNLTTPSPQNRYVQVLDDLFRYKCFEVRDEFIERLAILVLSQYKVFEVIIRRNLPAVSEYKGFGILTS